MDEKISKLFLTLLDKLYNTEPAGEPFRKPVDVVKYGCYDYYLYVKHPIDLSTIREKLLNNQYQGDAWRFVTDIQLMFSNAYLFNKKGTPVYEFTNKLSKIWNSELTPIMQRLNYCCGTLHKFGPQLLFCHGTTPDKYCQIPVGAKYKCYQDQYSFCMPCFNKIETDYINIQNLSCETARMKLPTLPVKKSDFNDFANDNWQYETFIKCTHCTRRVHQVCELYPAEENEIQDCIQHAQIEHEQKMLCQVPEEYRVESSEDERQDSSSKVQDSLSSDQQQEKKDGDGHRSQSSMSPDANQDEAASSTKANQQQEAVAALDDELLQFARDVDDSDLTNSAPTSPNPYDNKSRFDSSAKNVCQRKQLKQISNNSNRQSTSRGNTAATTTTNSNSSSATSTVKNSVDNIAARLSINKMSASEPHAGDEILKQNNSTPLSRDKFVCNHCYKKKKIGFNLRHRRYSARRLPHTRMSRYIETKVNEHIRENSFAAGEVTIRVLTAYRDTITVKPEMRDYVNRCRQKDAPQHSNLKEYPEEFGYTNRAIFAWQEIDGVDVCVFGMHVQEYGEDCPEPNRQVIYLSYLDSVHFFRPKQVRTAVYHEILLSYFKYVKKLGFRRVFIWVCPSRKGDDYIFYRHPTEQKMPTLKRLSDWYVNLLDKGIIAGIVERHQNIYQYASSQNWTSILSMPYLSGDYWPGEFERLLKIMIESQEGQGFRMKQHDRKDSDQLRPSDISELGESSRLNCTNDRPNERHNMLSLTSIYQKHPPNSSNGKALNLKASLVNSLGLRPSAPTAPVIIGSNGGISQGYFTPEGDYSNMSPLDEKFYGASTPDSMKSDYDQPLDLSKSSSNTSPESCFDDDRISELSFKTSFNDRKRRRKSSSMGYTKKRSRAASQIPSSSSQHTRGSSRNASFDGSGRIYSQPLKSCRQKSSTQSQRDFQGTEVLLDPEEELIKNLERSLKRQREGFIVARLNECDCSPHFESQRRKEETNFICDLMKGREPFLQLARLKNYEFSTLRRAKFSSLAMVKHLGQIFKLDPICNECFSFDSSKRHYACSHCEDFYLCTSCHENTHHEHIMSLMAPSTLPDIDEFLQQCSLASTANSISSASSTISNKSFNESNLEISSQSVTPTLRENVSAASSRPLNRHLSNSLYTSSTMPLSCQRQKNHSFGLDVGTRAEDEENSDFCSYGANTKLNSSPHQPSPPPSHSSNNTRNVNNLQIELDQVLVENFIRHAEVSYDVDFDQMKNESKKLLTHYWNCPMKETCHKCKFVVLSCSFMSVLMRSSRMQMMINCNPSEILPNNNNSNSHLSGINLTTAHRFSYQPKDK